MLQLLHMEIAVSSIPNRADRLLRVQHLTRQSYRAYPTQIRRKIRLGHLSSFPQGLITHQELLSFIRAASEPVAAHKAQLLLRPLLLFTRAKGLLRRWIWWLVRISQLLGPHRSSTGHHTPLSLPRLLFPTSVPQQAAKLQHDHRHHAQPRMVLIRLLLQ